MDELTDDVAVPPAGNGHDKASRRRVRSTVPKAPPKPGRVVIDLHTAKKPPDFIVIDGKRHPLADMDAWGLRQRAVLRRLTKRVGELEAIAEPTEQEDRDYTLVLSELLQHMLPTTDQAAIARLTRGQLIDLSIGVVAWIGERNLRLQEATAALAAALVGDS